MKIAIACWNDRVAPIFDNARQVHLLETESGKILSEQRILLQENSPVRNASLLSENGVSTLICGAISRSVERIVADRGISVIPFISGSLQEITQAWLDNHSLVEQFAMPGCCGRRRHGQGGGRGLGLGNGAGMGRGQGRGIRGACLADPVLTSEPANQAMSTTRGLGQGRGLGRRGMGGGTGTGMGAGMGNGRGSRRGGRSF